MKRILLLISLCALSLSACGAIQTTETPEPSPAAASSPISSTATDTPYPTATFIAIPTLPATSPSTSTSTATQTQPPATTTDCNIAEVVAEGLQEEATQPGASASVFTIILRLTNSGSCTWTPDYTVILAHNEGLEIEARQAFTSFATPGETVDVPVSITVPEEEGSYNAVWLIEDPNGDIFGFGQARDGLVEVDVVVNEEKTVVTVNDWLFPSERCDGQYYDLTLPAFARLMHDPQWMPWPSRMQDPGWHSHFYYDWYPETVQLWVNPAGGDGRLPYSREWLAYLRALQPDDDAAVWIARVGAGLFNKGNEFIPILDLQKLDKEPIAESISSGGNVVRIMEFRNNAARIQMLYFKDPIPSSRAVNYFTTPWLVTKFTSVSIDGDLGNAGGIDVYFPNLARQPEGYWVDMERIEFFPPLPKCVTIKTELNVRAEADGDSQIIGNLAPEQEILILEYLPQGSDVWGRFSDGWLLLEFQDEGQPVYPTTWRMATRPPIDFD